MNEKKPFLNSEDMCQKMINVKKIQVNDKIKLKNTFDRIPYFCFFTPYKNVLGIPKDCLGNHIYLNVDDKIIDFLYFKDKEISETIFSSLLAIELNLKTSIINSLGHYYTSSKKVSNELDFLSVLKIIIEESNKQNVNKTVEEIVIAWFSRNSTTTKTDIRAIIKNKLTTLTNIQCRKIYKNLKQKNLKHHYEKYNCIPLWYFISGLMWSELSSILQFLSTDIMCEISNKFSNSKVSDVTTRKNLLEY